MKYRSIVARVVALLAMSAGCGGDDPPTPPLDDPPVAAADVATVAEGSTATAVDVLGNDSAGDAASRAVASVTQPAHGTAAVGPSGGAVLYTPAAGYCNQAPNTPPDTFTYTLAPGGSTASVAVSVTCACGVHHATDFIVGSN